MSNVRTLLPPNATRLERAVETVMAEPKAGLEAPIGTLWNADTCPEELLPWLAWAFSVEVWDHEWPEDVRRDVIRTAILVHRRKGTREAVEIALGALGFRVELVEGWEEGGAPHTFRIDAFGEDVFAAGFEIGGRLNATVAQLIEHTKPVRSHGALRVGERFRDTVFLRHGVRQRQRHRARVKPALPVVAVAYGPAVRSGLRLRARDRITMTFNSEVATNG